MSAKHVSTTKLSYILARHAITTNRFTYTRPNSYRCYSTERQDAAAPKTDNDGKERTETASDNDSNKNPEEGGAMSRRLSEMTEEMMLEGGQSARRNMEQAGFSEDLKKRLEEKLAAVSFRNEYPAAHSFLDMPASAGQGTQDIAGASPWSGTESLHDSALRMLEDSSKKPIRGPYKIPQPTKPPVAYQRTPGPPKSPGLRIAKAKEKTSAYAQSQTPGLSQKERDAFRQEMHDKYKPAGAAMPLSISGLSSLANERIEDAMSSGHFKAIPRGKGVNTESDQNVGSGAFMDTTEFLLNKMIKRQEIVPPWIEKQQEVVKEVTSFRDRLRTAWRRHAARLIASQGGSLESQMRRAQAHAAAEARLAERAKIEASFQDDPNPTVPTVSESMSQLNQEGRLVGNNNPSSEAQQQQHQQPAYSGTTDDHTLPPLPPLRDPNYVSIERSFHELSIKELNNLTRSYNLQAPQVAQKAYLNLDRELESCYADVAPTLAEEIRRRATERARGSSSSSFLGSSSPGVLDSLGVTQPARVYDEDSSKGYGFREFFRDLFSRKGSS